MLLSKLQFKAVLNATVLSVKDMERLQRMSTEQEKTNFMGKNRKYTPMLFTIFERKMDVYNVKAKERIALKGALVDDTG